MGFPMESRKNSRALLLADRVALMDHLYQAVDDSVFGATSLYGVAEHLEDRISYEAPSTR
jgi:hypothetical protein